MFVCVCKGIKESDVQELGRCGIVSPKALASKLEIDDEDNCCGRCLNNINDFVAIASNACRSSVKV
ncbi:MAG: hypothetical protein VST68_00020 [Nitrospirota bacterium]|nr:hypothetical protein [Nitrospirota bacterium]